jgi:hypothetical protein
MFKGQSRLEQYIQEDTMRFVIDANQVSDIVRIGLLKKSCTTLVIAPLICAEIINASPHYLSSRLRTLALYDLVFGMDWSDILTNLRTLSEDEIQTFLPLLPTSSTPHKILLDSFRSSETQNLWHTTNLKGDAAKDRMSSISWLSKSKQEYKDTRSRGEPTNIAVFSSIEEADLHFISGDTAVRRRTILAQITEGNATIRASSPDTLFDAILKNASLRRFLRLDITFNLAYFDAWDNTDMNNIGDLQAGRNDGPDIMLALYARDGDTIVTNDRNFRKAFRFIDPDEKVRLATWSECVQ